MADFYAGNPLVYPTNITIPDDSDAADAATWAVGYQNLADRTAWISANMVNGLAGGTYAPSTPISIGGAGLDIPHGAVLNVEGTIHVAGGGTTQFDVGSSVVMSGATVDIHGATVVTYTGAGTTLEIDTTAELFVKGQTDFQGQVNAQSGSQWFFSNPNDYLSGASVTFHPGATLHLATGDLDAPGNAWIINDASDPLFANPRTRSIAQPFVILPGTTFPTPSVGAFAALDDTGNGSFAYISLTKLVNGAELASVDIFSSWASAHTPTNPARMTLYKIDLFTGAQTTLNSRTVPSNVGTSGLCPLAITPTETIDDTRYLYVLGLEAESGGGAQAMLWSPPIADCHNITSLRSI